MTEDPLDYPKNLLPLVQYARVADLRRRSRTSSGYDRLFDDAYPDYLGTTIRIRRLDT
jgi:hypothetical protein